MAKRAEQVRHLAELLTQREHSRPVSVRWAPAYYGPGPDGGAWLLSWTDGPSWDTLQDWARTLVAGVPRLAGLSMDGIVGHRTDSPTAWAASLLAEAGPSPWRRPPWRSAAQLVEHVDDTMYSGEWLDEIDDPGHAAAVRALLATGATRLGMARLVLAEWRALPPAATEWERRNRPTGRCQHCGRLFLCQPGPEQRWCTPACRLRHWRTTRPARTEPGNAPLCPVCEHPVRAAGTGRPGVYCTAVCRRLAHRHRDSALAVRAAAYAHRREHRPPDTEPDVVDEHQAAMPGWAGPRPRRTPRPPLPPDLQGCLLGGTTVHQLHLVVDEIDPPIWRRLQIPSAMPLVRVSDVLCTAMGWSGDHLHSFGLPDDRGGFGGVDPREFTTTLGELLQGVDWRLSYWYDFGDDWLLTGTVEKILTRPAATTFYPRVTAGRRNGPAEDCGGPPGYQQLLTALRARKGWRYQQAREQHGRWKPEDFDRDAINQDLQSDYRHALRTTLVTGS